MLVEENVPLATLTTLKVGGRARYVLTVASVEEVQEAVAFAQERSLPLRVLGGGSNVLASDAGFAGVIVRMQIQGIAYEEQGSDTLVRVGAGVEWDVLVESVAQRGLWGLENLAGIPGSVDVLSISQRSARTSSQCQYLPRLRGASRHASRAE